MNTSSDFLIFDFLPGELVECLFDFVNSSSISQFPFSFLIEVLAYFFPWDVLTCIPLAVSVLNLSPQYLHLKLCDSWVPSSNFITSYFLWNRRLIYSSVPKYDNWSLFVYSIPKINIISIARVLEYSFCMPKCYRDNMT